MSKEEMTNVGIERIRAILVETCDSPYVMSEVLNYIGAQAAEIERLKQPLTSSEIGWVMNSFTNPYTTAEFISALEDFRLARSSSTTPTNIRALKDAE